MSKICEAIRNRYYCGTHNISSKSNDSNLEFNCPPVEETLEKIKSNESDMVHHPKHYDNGDSTYEPYRVISAWKKNFNIGSAIKYLARYEKKFNPIEDLQKAIQYIEFEIEELKKTK